MEGFLFFVWLIAGVVGIFLSILWILMPFAVFRISEKMDKSIAVQSQILIAISQLGKETRITNDLLRRMLPNGNPDIPPATRPTGKVGNDEFYE
jgi:hypothetical protein